MAEESKIQVPAQTASDAASQQQETQKKMVKVPLVKRIKVPVARPAASPAPVAAQPAREILPQPEETPAIPVSAADEASLPATDPAVRAEAGHTPVAEPALAPEVKTNINPSAIEAEEIEREPVRKRRRINSKTAQAAKNDNTQEMIKKAKEKVGTFWDNRLIRMGIFIVIFLIISGGVYSYLPNLAGQKLPEIFAANGMPFRSFKIKSLTMDTIELSNVSDTSGTVSIMTMKAKYSLWSLVMSGHLDELELNGLSVTGEKTDEGIHLGAISQLVTAPMRVNKKSELVIDRLKIVNSRFILNQEEPEQTPAEAREQIENTDEMVEEEPEGPLTVNFTANGSLKTTGLQLNISTDLSNKQLTLQANATFSKTPTSAQITAEITEGNVLNNKTVEGSVTGTLDISVRNGALERGTADLTLSTPVQDLTLKTEVLPSDAGFNLDAQMNRSFKKPEEAFGKFVGDLTIKAPNITMSGNLQKFEGAMPLTLEASALTNGKIAMQKMKSSTELKLVCENYDCKYDLTRPLQIDLGGLNVAGLFTQIKTYEPLSVTINPNPKETFMTSDNGLLSFNMPLSGFIAKMMLINNKTSSQTAVAVNGAKMALKYNIFAGTYAGNITFSQSGYVDRDIKMSNVQGAVSFSQGTLPEARFAIGNAVLTKQNTLPPMSAELSFHPMKGDEYSVDMSVQMLNGLASGSAKGSYTLSSREWNLYLNIPKLTFSPSGLTLESVFPSLAGYLSADTSGTVAAKGRMSIVDGKVLGPISVMIDNVSTMWGGIKAVGINGVLSLTSLFPFETAINQQIFIGSFNPGLPFKNALFNFKVSPVQGMQVASVRMGFADGQFKSIKPFILPYEGTPSPIYMEGRGINLGMLSQMLKTQSLQMDGTMDSDWKLLLVDKKLVVDNADFQSKMGGLLRFDAPPEARKVMDKEMQEFLKNVIVKDLLLSIKGPMDGLLNFRLGIRGHSPLDTAQKDKELSVDFSGDFKNFLRQDIPPYELPSDILLSLQNYLK